MIQKLKRILMSIAMLGVVGMPALVPVSVAAQEDITDGLKCGAEFDVSNVDAPACEPPSEPSDKLNNIIRLVINIFSLIVGVIAVVMIIIGGLKYITSGGDSGNVTGAKNTILYAVVGLVVVALAQFIVRFVLDKVATD